MLLAIDQGTTGTTCLVVDEGRRVVGRGYREITQHFPAPGLVEHDPEEIWQSVLATAQEALQEARIDASDLAGIGITNQRETTVVWERATGRPVHPAIVWQDRRTSERCATLPADLLGERTGLLPDPYFSATKLEWILARTNLPQRSLAFGTIDTWLAWQLTRGDAHVTDVTNASRTMLMRLETAEWDPELLDLFGIEPALLPRIVPSAGVVAEAELFGASVPLGGIAGDQQSALFGHGCVTAGEAKATYGTGTFVLANVGETPVERPAGLLQTAVAVAPGTAAQFALEGAVLVGGAALQWLRDGLGLIASAAESEALAREVASSEGVYVVPALTGLGAPTWDPDARGLICGLTRGTTRAHVVRATLEGIAHQVADVLEVLPLPLETLRVDGGATRNGFLMQLQSDLLGTPVEVADEVEATGLGAASLAGLAVGTWPDVEALERLREPGRRYEPQLGRDEALRLREGWREALARATTR